MQVNPRPAADGTLFYTEHRRYEIRIEARTEADALAAMHGLRGLRPSV